MLYRISYTKAYRHFIDIDLIVNEVKESQLEFQLPSWRPGRYELGDFAKNIKSCHAYDGDGNPLAVAKQNKDKWLVETQGSDCVHIRYQYYANEMNAGSTYLDDFQLYMNGVNCLMYVPGREEEACAIDLVLPLDYEIACALEPIDDHFLMAKNYEELVESPLIASANLQHGEYTVNKIDFHIWFQGPYKPDWNRLYKDFTAFTQTMLDGFGKFPVKTYHFMFQTTDYPLRHGVEHTASTVIALGPSSKIDNVLYEELIGISSHELYHTWNIKQIRPIELLPYDYTKENYSKLGYLCEGVTTYMGDLFLFKSEVFNQSEFFKTQEENLNRHFHNEGRLNMSLADSSFDTWLDGYVAGVPGRKVSIYTEGALCSLMLDLIILNKSKGEQSLQDLINTFYYKYARKNKGISEQIYKDELTTLGGDQAAKILEDHVYGIQDYRESLDLCLSYVGLAIEEQPNPDFFASKLGVKMQWNGKNYQLTHVFSASEADQMGMAVGDRILSINGTQMSLENRSQLSNEAMQNEACNLEFANKYQQQSIQLTTKGNYFVQYKLFCVNADNEQVKLYDVWSKK